MTREYTVSIEIQVWAASRQEAAETGVQLLDSLGTLSATVEAFPPAQGTTTKEYYEVKR